MRQALLLILVLSLFLSPPSAAAAQTAIPINTRPVALAEARSLMAERVSL